MVSINASYATLSPVEDGEVPSSTQRVTFYLRDLECRPISGVHVVHFLVGFTSADGHEGTLHNTRALSIDGVVSFEVVQEETTPGQGGNPAVVSHTGAYNFRVGCITCSGTVISEPFTIPAP